MLLKFLFQPIQHPTSGCIDRPVLLPSTTRKLELGLPLSSFDNKCLREYENYINSHKDK